jgi:hypothetical protein
MWVTFFFSNQRCQEPMLERRVPLAAPDENVLDWKWSSARWYKSLTPDADLPRLTPLLPHFCG